MKKKANLMAALFLSRLAGVIIELEEEDFE